MRELRYRSIDDTMVRRSSDIVWVGAHGVIIALTSMACLIPWSRVIDLTFSYGKDDEMVGWLR